jgi:hypothetical protein
MNLRINTFLTFLLLFINGILFSQIENGGFEIWQSLPYYDAPVGWETNQDSNFVRFEKSDFVTEGDYSLKIVSSSFTSWTDCNSIARTSVTVDPENIENLNLNFYLKSIPDSTSTSDFVFLLMKFYLFESNDFKGSFYWESYDIIEDYTFQQIPIIHDEDFDSIRIEIVGGAWNGPTDGCHDHTISWIDNMRLDNTSSLSENVNLESEINVFPNPSQGIINISSTLNLDNEYQLIDNHGRIVQKGKLHNNTIYTDRKGVYALKLFSEINGQNKSIVKRIVLL